MSVFPKLCSSGRIFFSAVTSNPKPRYLKTDSLNQSKPLTVFNNSSGYYLARRTSRCMTRKKAELAHMSRNSTQHVKSTTEPKLQSCQSSKPSTKNIYKEDHMPLIPPETVSCSREKFKSLNAGRCKENANLPCKPCPRNLYPTYLHAQG